MPPLLVGPERVRRHPHPALDPPLSAASPAVPALMGPGPQCHDPSAARRLARRCLQICNLLKLGQNLTVVLSKKTHDLCVTEEFADVAFGNHQVEVVRTVGFLSQPELVLQAG